MRCTQEIPIKDLVDGFYDGPHATPPEAETGPVFLGIKNVTPEGRLDFSAVRRLSEQDFPKWTRRVTPQENDIVFSYEATLHRYARIPTGFVGCLGRRMALVRPNPSKVDSSFLHYFFLSPIWRAKMEAITIVGATVNRLLLTLIPNVGVDLPDLAVQKAIADILSAYDDLIENNRRRIELLERAAREIYREWFVRLRFPGHEHTKIIEGVPEGWDRVHLSEVVSTQYGYTASANDEPVGPKFLRGTDINKQSYIDWSTVPYCPGSGLNFEKYALRRGDLLVIRMADPGKVAIVEKETKAIFASYLVRLLVRTDSGIDPLYLFYVLADVEYQGFIRAASGGSTRKSASAKLLTDFRVLRPPKNVQDIFVDQIRPLREMIGTLLEQISKANLSRDLLLPRLMDGRIRV